MRGLRLWVAAMVLGLLLPGVCSAQGGKGVAFARAGRLRRGVNLSLWYAQTGDYSAGRLDGFTGVADFKLIRKLGFDHVRLPIDPEWVFAGGELKAEPMARLDRTVKELNDAGLAVILDVHPEEKYKAGLGRGDEGVARFGALWVALAGHFAGTDPERVFFEVMNEPTLEDGYRWQGIQARVVAVIRGAAPRHTVLATAAQWSSVADTLRLEPVRDENVIYTFHEYNPMWFTHQGATWGMPEWVGLRGVPYPSTEENVQGVVKGAENERVKRAMERYGKERWGAERIAQEIGTVADWAAKRGVPLYCGEFGAFKVYSEPGMRDAWIRDVRTALEARHIGWAMWDYQTEFGVVMKTGGETTVDPGVAKALGVGLDR